MDMAFKKLPEKGLKQIYILIGVSWSLSYSFFFSRKQNIVLRLEKRFCHFQLSKSIEPTFAHPDLSLKTLQQEMVDPNLDNNKTEKAGKLSKVGFTHLNFNLRINNIPFIKVGLHLKVQKLKMTNLTL